MAAAFFTMRSFCELIFVGEYDRNVVNLIQMKTARDVIYGLFTAPALAALYQAIPRGDKDFFHKTRIESEKEINLALLPKIVELSDNGGKTSPSMELVLEEVLKTIKMDLFAELQSLKGSLREKRERSKLLIKQEYHAKYIEYLKGYFADWEPIQRWNGGEAQVVQHVPVEEGSRTASEESSTVAGQESQDNELQSTTLIPPNGE
jgi:hypothetical protein